MMINRKKKEKHIRPLILISFSDFFFLPLLQIIQKRKSQKAECESGIWNGHPAEKPWLKVHKLLLSGAFTHMSWFLATDDKTVFITDVSRNYSSSSCRPWVFFFFLNNECLLELFTARTVCSQRQAHKPKRLGTTGLKKSLSKKKTLNRFINILCNDENNDQLQLDSSFSFSSSFLSYYIVFIM